MQTHESKTGIVALHGFSSAPLEVNELATYLNKKALTFMPQGLKAMVQRQKI